MSEKTFRHIFLQKLSPKHYFSRSHKICFMLMYLPDEPYARDLQVQGACLKVYQGKVSHFFVRPMGTFWASLAF